MPRWFFRYVGTKTFASSCKIRNFGPKRPNLVQNMLFCPFWPNIGNFGPFCPMPDKNTMQTRCLCVFSGIWVPKLLLSPVRIRIFCPKRLNLARNWYFWSFLARPCWLMWCPIGGLVGGCGARALSRKTPIYFIFSCCDRAQMQGCALCWWVDSLLVSA